MDPCPGRAAWLLAAIPRQHLPAGLSPGGTALFCLFHGYAHGAEAPAAGSVAGYLIGFTLATAALQGLGIAVGRRLPVIAARSAGPVIALTGVGFAALG